MTTSPPTNLSHQARAAGTPLAAPADPRWHVQHTARTMCCEWLQAARILAAEQVKLDLIYVDPPFNTGQTQSDRAGSYDDRFASTRAYIDWLRERLLVSIPLLRATGSLLVHVDWRTSHHVRLLLDDVLGEDHFVNHLIWSYGLGGSSPRRFARKHDDILFYCIDPQSYYFNPPMIPATSARMAGKLKKSTDVLQFPDVLDIPSINNQATERTGYPTQKPLALLSMLIDACSPPAESNRNGDKKSEGAARARDDVACGSDPCEEAGGGVWDPCCGSGTTIVAAARTSRRAFGTDFSPDAIAITRQRLADMQQIAELFEGGAGFQPAQSHNRS